MKTERLVQVLILIVIAAMAGAASFTHVHDWTMHNAPAGTGSWFGWANAVISELTPTAAGIEIRRRKRRKQQVAYPMTVLIAAAVLSLAAQVAEARPTPAGWISSAVPALAFLALTKLVLSRTSATPGEPSCPQTTSAPIPAGGLLPTTTGTTAPAGPQSPSETTAPSAGNSFPATRTPDGSAHLATSAPTAGTSTSIPTAAPAAATLTHDRLGELRPVPSGQLLFSARMTAFAHHQETGHPITSGQLADRLTIPEPLAASLLDHLDGTTPPPVTAVNGTPAPPGDRP